MRPRPDRVPPRPALLGLLLALVVLGLLVAWWLWSGGPGQRTVPAARAPGAPARSAERPLPAVLGPITRFDRRVAEELLRERPPTTALRGSLRLTAERVSWDDARGQAFLRADRATGRLDLDAMLRGDAIVSSVEAVRPRVWLFRPTGDTTWNWEQVLAGFLSGPAGGTPGAPRRKPLVEVRGLTVRDGFASVRQPRFETRFLGIEATLPRIAFSGPDLPDPIVQVARARATFERPDLKWRLALTARDGTITVEQHETRYTVAELAFGRSIMTGIAGLYDPRLPGLGVRATGTAPNLELADLKTFAPTLDLSGGGSFTWALEPTADNGVRVALSGLRFTEDGSRVTGDVTFSALSDSEKPALQSADLRLSPLRLDYVERLAGRKLPYAGAVTGRVTGSGANIRFDLTGRLATGGVAPFTVTMTGGAAFTPDGVTLRDAVAELREVPLAALRPLAPGVGGRGKLSGRIALSGPLARAPLRLDVRLDLPSGQALVNGTLTLAGAASTYDVTGRLSGVGLRDLVNANIPPVLLTADFAARGTGLQPATATAAFRLDGRFTGWRTDENDRVLARGSVASGVLRLDTLAAGLASARMNATGAWPFSAPGTGAIAYRAEVADLAPFAPYLPEQAAGPASGAASFAGTVGGTLRRPLFNGSLALSRARAGAWGVESGAGTYSVQLGDTVPRIGLELQTRGVTTPTAGSFSAFDASIRLAAPSLEVVLRAERAGGGVIELTAGGSVPVRGTRVVTVSRLLADVGPHRWQLLRPAVVRWVPGGSLTVRDLLVQETGGPGRIALTGTLLPADASDYRLEMTAIPVAEFYRLAARQPPLSGLLYATAEVRGPAAAPQVSGTFRLDSGVVQGVKLTALQGSLQYREGRVSAEARAALEQGGSVIANAALPVTLALGLPPRARLLGSGTVQGSLVADTVPLALLSSATTQVRDVTGVFSARMSLAGTAGEPILAGTATLRGGALTVPAANQRYTALSGTLTLRDRRILVDSVTARSDGTMTLAGTIEFPELRNPLADLSLLFRGFRPLGTADNPQAAVQGRLTITGPLLTPTVRGAVRLEDGNLLVPTGGATGDIVGEATALGVPDFSATPGAEAVPALPISERIRLDGVQLTAGRDVWFQMPDARVQLSGTLTVDKAPDAGMRILGTLEGERGTYAVVAGLFVRRLDITQARIRFLGTGELNPQLDILATKTVLDPSSTPVDIQARVTGTLENPRLSLSTAQGVQIPESELLSFLVFGQPSFALGTGELGVSLLQQTVYGGVTELASMQLQESLTASGLPLDVFEVQSSATGVPSRLVIGREVAPDVFITVQTAIGALFGNTGQNVGGPLALRLDWRVSRRLTSTLGWEPTGQARTLRGFYANLPQQQLTEGRKNQITVELRRRWSY